MAAKKLQQAQAKKAMGGIGMAKDDEREQELEELEQQQINNWIYWAIRNQRAKQREAEIHQDADRVAQEMVESLEALHEDLESILKPLFEQDEALRLEDGGVWSAKPWSNSERQIWNEKKKEIIDELEKNGVTSGTQDPVIAANQASAAKDRRTINRARAVAEVIDTTIAAEAAKEISEVKTHLEASFEKAAESVARELEDIENAKRAEQAKTERQTEPEEPDKRTEQEGRNTPPRSQNGTQDAKNTSQGTNTQQTQNNASQATGTPILTPTIPQSTPTVGTYDQSVIFDRPTPDQIRAAVMQEIDGRDFSDRIWKNKKKLAEVLKSTILDALLNGEGLEETARKVAQKLNASFNDSLRLIRTETNRVLNQATLAQMKAAGIEWYTFTAIIDDRTTVMCRFMNMKVFKVADAMVGINYPPLHPNCRSTVVAGKPGPNDTNEANIPQGQGGESTQSGDPKETIDIDKDGNVINGNGEPDVSWIREMTADWAREVASNIKSTQPEAAQQIEAAADKVAQKPNVENIRKLAAEQDKANARKDYVVNGKILKSRKKLGQNKDEIKQAEVPKDKADAIKREIERKRTDEERSIINEIEESGVKIKKSDVVFAIKVNGRNIWLETGNDSAGLRHILNNHEKDFNNIGVKTSEIPDFVKDIIMNGEFVGERISKKKKKGVVLKFQGRCYTISIGDNGFIVGAFPFGDLD